MVLLWLFYHRTHIGLSMLAASIDAEGAATIGIHVGRMRTLTFLLGGLVGGLAGVLVSPLITLHYEMGLLLTLKGFAAAILGGLFNPFGAVVGGVVLGLVESLAVLAVSSGYKDVIAMAILIAHHDRPAQRHSRPQRRGRAGDGRRASMSDAATLIWPGRPRACCCWHGRRCPRSRRAPWWT